MNKPSQTEKKQKLRELHRNDKIQIEENLSSKNTETLYGTRQSASRYENQRQLILYYESKESAEQRSQKRKNFLNYIFKARLNCSQTFI